jgi:dinuclear metal center YbgI/SA1388 family protein
MLVQDVCAAMEKWAPLAWQESYDNSGLLVGQKDTQVTGILISLDCTEEVVDEALQRGCNMIISHHPIIFKGLKKITGANYVEKTIIKAIQNSISLYACHTNLDHAPLGVSYHLAKKIGLQGKVLMPFSNALKNLSYFVPEAYEEMVREKLHEAGAGNIGEYSSCSFSSEGTGRFTPSENSNPFQGEKNSPSAEKELKVDMIFPSHLENEILRALKEAHPYEEVAYYMTNLSNRWQEVGSGFIGQLEKPMSSEDFLAHLKIHLDLGPIRHTALLNKEIRTVAVCGGAGSFLLNEAKKQKADAYVSADFKYHEFFDAENKCLICDIGHYESEVMIKDAILDYLSNIFSTFAVLKSDICTNPVLYT